MCDSATEAAVVAGLFVFWTRATADSVKAGCCRFNVSTGDEAMVNGAVGIRPTASSSVALAIERSTAGFFTAVALAVERSTAGFFTAVALNYYRL